MTRAPQKKSLRRSMMQLHTWAGLPLGWLFFFIFVTGALSFYHQEITVWMQPETHKVRSSDTGVDRAFEILRREASAAGTWIIILPSERIPYITAAWQEPSATQRGGRPGMKRLAINPEDGELIEARPTAGGSFLYRLHVQLFGLERATGMTIVAIATLVMLLALVSGLFVHPTIFRDFFTFRPGRGKLSWRDAHNATAVLSYPFHIVITLSGLLLICPSIMTPIIQVNYGTDIRSFIMATRGMESKQQPVQAGIAKKDGKEGGPEQETLFRKPLETLSPILLEAGKRWANGVGVITITNPSGSDPKIELREARPNVLRGGNEATEKMVFDGKSGQRIALTEGLKPGGVGISIWQTIIAIHRGHFAGTLARFLLFASGLCGAGMVATGLVMWNIVRNKQKNDKGNIPFGHHIVESLNIAAIPGLFIALACYFACSRILPAEMMDRIAFEKQTFFIAWAIALAHAMLRRPKSRAWVEQFVVAGSLLFCLPVINAATGGAHFFLSVGKGLWPVAGFDLFAATIGLTFLLIAGKIIRKARESSFKNSEDHKKTSSFDPEFGTANSGALS